MTTPISGKHDLALRQPEPLPRPVAEPEHDLAIEADEVAVNPEHALAAVGQVKRFGFFDVNTGNLIARKAVQGIPLGAAKLPVRIS